LVHIRQVSRSQMASDAIDSFVSGVNQYDQEVNKAQVELMQLKDNLTSAEAELTVKNTLLESRRSDVVEIESARNELGVHQVAIKSKEGEINWLRSHVAQLTQSLVALTLPPGHDEARKKR